MSWRTDDIPDLSGKLALVTGGNSGIGYWTCLHLARKGARVVMASRSKARAAAAIDELRAAVPDAQIDSVTLDLSDLNSVRAAVDEVRARHVRLDRLCLNAGVALSPLSRTADGFESQFAANFLGHFALTGQLLDLLCATPDCRVVHVGSVAHRIGKIVLDDPNFKRRRYSRWRGYGQSKLANVVFMLELERRFRREGLSAISVGAHPGFSATNIAASVPFANWPPMYRLFSGSIQTPEQGAGPSLYAATAAGVSGGSYFGPSGWLEIRGAPGPARIARVARDEKVAQDLWDVAERLTGVRFLD